MSRLDEQQGEAQRSPYWAYCWAGGLALARHILDHPEIVAGRRVLDLGAGSGLVGIAAAKAGAAEVVAAEIDPYALAAIGLNAALNGVAIRILEQDFTASTPPVTDIILVGDLFYDGPIAKQLMGFLERRAATGTDVLIGDPWRAFLPRRRLTVIAEYHVAETDGAAPKRAGIFIMRRPS